MAAAARSHSPPEMGKGKLGDAEAVVDVGSVVGGEFVLEMCGVVCYLCCDCTNEIFSF